MRIICFAAAVLLLSGGLGVAKDTPIPNEPLFHKVANKPVKNSTQRKARTRLVCTSLGDECTSFSECCAGEGTGCGWVAGCPVGKKCCY
jgi:hypothetical protein